jgi:hypothetical protein
MNRSRAAACGFHHLIASKLRRDPRFVRVLAKRLRSKIATSPSHEIDDNHWEWYFILALWPTLEVVRLLEDTNEQAESHLKKSILISLLSEKEKRASWLHPLALGSCGEVEWPVALGCITIENCFRIDGVEQTLPHRRDRPWQHGREIS